MKALHLSFKLNSAILSVLSDLCGEFFNLDFYKYYNSVLRLTALGIGYEMQMNDDQAINYLFDLSTFGWKLGLETITAMLNELGNPQEKYRTIHIAGTNGKGSTSAMIESILRAAGYKTGLYTSPHLVYVGERIRCDGQSIEKENLVSYINYIKPLIEKYHCTFFEAMTMIAFL